MRVIEWNEKIRCKKKRIKKNSCGPLFFSHFKSLVHFVFMLVWASSISALQFSAWKHFVVFTFGWFLFFYQQYLNSCCTVAPLRCCFCTLNASKNAITKQMDLLTSPSWHSIILTNTHTHTHTSSAIKAADTWNPLSPGQRIGNKFIFFVHFLSILMRWWRWFSHQLAASSSYSSWTLLMLVSFKYNSATFFFLSSCHASFFELGFFKKWFFSHKFDREGVPRQDAQGWCCWAVFYDSGRHCRKTLFIPVFVKCEREQTKRFCLCQQIPRETDAGSCSENTSGFVIVVHP